MKDYLTTYEFVIENDKTVFVEVCGEYANSEAKDIAVCCGNYYREYEEAIDADDIMDDLKDSFEFFPNQERFVEMVILWNMIRKEMTVQECLDDQAKFESKNL